MTVLIGFLVTNSQSLGYSNDSKSYKDENSDNPKKESQRIAEFRKKLRETTPINDLGEQPFMHPAQKEDPLPPFPNNTNPKTGEVGGPRGPEPTRYGDWERKGRVSDF
ncbi:succinate dehydrogenase assembly factor 4, mitochondrial-like isoform X2 [Galleria mellonella]|uniref:Succinate dehydrogenase assembly factor 4, mitochondrial n=1 Tax=Galleria mellonella TaxID=7137 RepID=A0A6J3BVI3_GALME|nr:succinate dehydrogenase assembly factor 4, mitochondrial-like isoform X2 [Galleria mellonella]